MKVILSTRNPSKMRQIQALFEGSSVSLQTLDDALITGEAVEDGTTLEENSEKKARYALERSNGFWTMADDTGLFVDALDGEPGIQAAYWGGDLSTEERMRYCLERMKGVTNRRATFRTTVVILSPEGERYTFNGEVHGMLLPAPRCAPQPKMPYSALFVPDGQPLTWAEMTTEYENAISHRGKAFREARAFFEALQ